MKVKIGPYKKFWGPYQIADLLKYIGLGQDKRYKLGEYLAETKVGKFCEWVELVRVRTFHVKIHKYDTWSMDSTLALIILPMLIQLKATKHGAPAVDELDVPEELRQKSPEEDLLEFGQDANFFKRWEWVMDEMIWAFTQINAGNSSEKFYKYPPAVKGESISEVIKKTEVDLEGLMAHEKRIANGTRLFGVYYQSLWD